eukprot:CAMPEP_0197914384 /NCGR_PEP_ID=MMETSP1439-20131203/78411_1 /TAXON_ID=66791 /ORGANISM="Gonyaulax spinifera, Strain CCMP409" /LENGTH=339 /DNA_ID=CAMNT_0043536293 /DNA_START=70 /DNA_END=1089 /DNA_ORIENTATION=-
MAAALPKRVFSLCHGPQAEPQAARKRRKLEEQETTAGSSSGNDDSDTSSQSGGEPPATSALEAPCPAKAYRNEEFLNSDSARLIRVMCELEEPGARLNAEGVENVVMFFGSARARPRHEYEAALRTAQARAAEQPDDAAAKAALARLQKQAFLVPAFDAVRELARKLTEWSAARAAAGSPGYVVGTGGGPGMMAAANKGAAEADGPSAGFGISLPFEDGLNPHVTPRLGFEFHYFFTRKFWMTYKCKALVVAPGGFGTCDELFELLTLLQTGKIKRKIPVILLGRKFWTACINWEAFVEYGMISESDAAGLIFADTAEEAFPHLVSGIERLEVEEAACC